MKTFVIRVILLGIATAAVLLVVIALVYPQENKRPAFFTFLNNVAARAREILTPRPRGHGGRANITAARTFIANIQTAVDSFQADNGYYPTGKNAALQDLIRLPSGATNWHGPYLDDVPKDPWGRDFFYVCPGKHAASGRPYDIFSLGPPEGNQPVVNWK